MAKYPDTFRRRQGFFDKFHKGFVGTLMFITVGGLAFFGYQVHDYYNRVKPLRLEQWRQGKYYEMSEEQIKKEEELKRLASTVEKWYLTF